MKFEFFFLNADILEICLASYFDCNSLPRLKDAECLQSSLRLDLDSIFLERERERERVRGTHITDDDTKYIQNVGWTFSPLEAIESRLSSQCSIPSAACVSDLQGFSLWEISGSPVLMFVC